MHSFESTKTWAENPILSASGIHVCYHQISDSKEVWTTNYKAKHSVTIDIDARSVIFCSTKNNINQLNNNPMNLSFVFYVWTYFFLNIAQATAGTRAANTKKFDLPLGWYQQHNLVRDGVDRSSQWPTTSLGKRQHWQAEC